MQFEFIIVSYLSSKIMIHLQCLPKSTYRLCLLHFEARMLRNSWQNKFKINAISMLFKSNAGCSNIDDDVAANDDSNVCLSLCLTPMTPGMIY